VAVRQGALALVFHKISNVLQDFPIKGISNGHVRLSNSIDSPPITPTRSRPKHVSDCSSTEVNGQDISFKKCFGMFWAAHYAAAPSIVAASVTRTWSASSLDPRPVLPGCVSVRHNRQQRAPGIMSAGVGNGESWMAGLSFSSGT
jgi:hypothetical protein